jgi:hypothetical protein
VISVGAMRHRAIALTPGVTAKVSWHGDHYPHPDWLPNGATVKVIGEVDHGFCDIEFEGKTFHLFIGYISTGYEFEVNPGQWTSDANHPLVKAQLEAWRRQYRGFPAS